MKQQLPGGFSVSEEGDRVRASWSFVLVSILHKQQMISDIGKSWKAFEV